jgi:hypothetical protein
MSVSSTSYFSNSVVGVPNIASDVKIIEQSETPRFAIGTKFERQDGAIFRYVHFGADINSAGLLVGADVSEIGVETIELNKNPSSAYQMPDDQYSIYPGQRNSRYMIINKSGVSVDDYAGGYLTIVDYAGQIGHTYRIKGNTASGVPLSGYFRAELYSRLMTTVANGTVISIAGCKYNNVEPAAWTNSDVAVGVSIQSSSTTKCYGWVQTKGIAACLQDTTTPLSSYTAYMSTGGSVGEVGMHVETETGLTTVPAVGKYVQGGTASWYTFVDLQLD